MKCPLEGEVAPESCAACYASLRHVPCPLDLHNPIFVKECLRTSIEALKREYPGWEAVEIE